MATTIRYIDSSAKKFYKSEFIPRSATGCVEIPLRKSERGGWTSAPNWNRHSDNNGKKKPDGPKRGLHNIPPKVMVMANAYRGNTVMMTNAAFAAAYGYSPGFGEQ